MAIPLPALSPAQTSPSGTPWRALKGGLLQFDTGRIVRPAEEVQEVQGPDP